MADTTKMTLSDIRQEVGRRNKHVEDMKKRFDKLDRELQAILLDIEGLEGHGAPRKRRGRRPASDETAEVAGEKAPAEAGEIETKPEAASPVFPQEGDAPRKRRGRPPKSDAAPSIPGAEPDAIEVKAVSPATPARKGPSIVDAAVDVLKSWGKPMNSGELALRIEERGVVSGNTQQVLLMAAGRRSRIAKNEDGTIGLIPEEGTKAE